MWKKDEAPFAENPVPDPVIPSPPPRSAPAPKTERATIGRSITVRGDVTGDEDLVIEGRVEGTVNLQEHSVTVGATGEVDASIVGRVVTVEGRVKGNITAEEQAVLRSSAFVLGDITAPRVVLEDGARFRGGVDMGEGDEPVKSASPGASSNAKRAPDAAKPTSEPGRGAAGVNAPLVGKVNGPSKDTAAEIPV